MSLFPETSLRVKKPVKPGSMFGSSPSFCTTFLGSSTLVVVTETLESVDEVLEVVVVVVVVEVVVVFSSSFLAFFGAINESTKNVISAAQRTMIMAIIIVLFWFFLRCDTCLVILTLEYHTRS